jgi:hypothetical protein
VSVNLRGAVIACAISLTAAVASADAVMVTRAMTAGTIMEAFIADEGITIELEVGASDAAAFGELVAPATSAERLPIPVPKEAGLAVYADGQRLPGSVEFVARRKRVNRDEVTGDTLPPRSADEAEDVVFLELRYRFRTRPEEVVFEPPLNENGYPATDIGFVAYHHGIAVNDFRYLSGGEPLALDWADPFYSRFERRTLNRKYGSPMNVFLYVEPFEVRKEFVVRPLDLARFMGIDIEAREPVPASERPELLRKLASFLAERAPVTIDGQRPEPILDRIHFLKRGLRMTRVVTPDEPVDGTSAIVGAIFVYPVDGIPKDVRLTWDLFDERVTRVPASATDEAGPMPSVLTPDDPELHWVNYLKGATMPGELEVAAPQSHLLISMSLLGACLLALAVLALAARRRSWALGLTALALLAGGWFLPPVRSIAVPIPASVRTPSGAEAAPTLHALLYNVYRALDFRQEEVVFDRLAQSLSGDILERVYLEMRKGLRLENQGGARVRVREVELLDVVPQESPDPGALRYRVRWNATGSVGHWGHTHLRTNAYDARISLGQRDNRWKIADIDIIEEQRVTANPPQ